MRDRPTEHRGSASRDRARQAAIELGQTDVGRGTARGLVALFLLTVVGVPVADLVLSSPEVSADEAAIHAAAEDTAAARVDAAEGVLVRHRALRRAMSDWEEAIEDRSLTRRWVMPAVQRVLTERLGVGNERVIVGEQGWLFFRDDVASVIGPDILDPREQHRRVVAAATDGGEIAADPIPAILRFRDDLRERGIELILLPVPVKPTIEPAQLGTDGAAVPVHNVGFATFVERLERQGVQVFDPAGSILGETKTDRAPTDGLDPRGSEAGALRSYLARDTHWRPDTLRRVASDLARAARRRVDLPPADATAYRRRPATVSGQGDTARMLGVADTTFPRQEVTAELVTDRSGRLWRADPRATVLLLGDSFSEIYSNPDLGWGSGAGLAEQLAAELGLPIDRIAARGAGAHASREALVRELARGDDRLATKQLVIWQFATRELAQGDWRDLPLP